MLSILDNGAWLYIPFEAVNVTSGIMLPFAIFIWIKLWCFEQCNCVCYLYSIVMIWRERVVCYTDTSGSKGVNPKWEKGKHLTGLSIWLFLTDLIEIFDLYFILMHTKDLTIFPGESLVFRFYCGLVQLPTSCLCNTRMLFSDFTRV